MLDLHEILAILLHWYSLWNKCVISYIDRFSTNLKGIWFLTFLKVVILILRYILFLFFLQKSCFEWNNYLALNNMYLDSAWNIPKVKQTWYSHNVQPYHNDILTFTSNTRNKKTHKQEPDPAIFIFFITSWIVLQMFICNMYKIVFFLQWTLVSQVYQNSTYT